MGQREGESKFGYNIMNEWGRKSEGGPLLPGNLVRDVEGSLLWEFARLELLVFVAELLSDVDTWLIPRVHNAALRSFY